MGKFSRQPLLAKPAGQCPFKNTFPPIIIIILCISLSNIALAVCSLVMCLPDKLTIGHSCWAAEKTPQIKKCPTSPAAAIYTHPSTLGPRQRLFIHPWKSVMWRWKDKKLTPRGFLWQVKKGMEQQYCFIPFKQVALLDWKTAVREVEREKTQIFPSNTFIGERKKYIFLKQLSCWRCSPQSGPILCAKGSENREMLALPNAFQGREDNRG